MTQPTTPPQPATDGKPPAWAMQLLRGAAISVGLGVIFAWFGVYGTGEFPMAQRIVYWSGLIALGAACAVFITPWIFERWMAKSHPALQIAVASLLISAPVTIGIILLESAGDGTVTQPLWWAQQYLYVVVVSAILTTGGWVLDRLKESKAAASPASTSAGVSSSFTDRLPMKFRTAGILAVSAEDHYLRVHTSAGETMLLMRLADAIRELSGVEGLQTHRSWWVARQGLLEASRDDGKLTLKLKSGAEAPVSRTYAKAVKDAGWL